MQVDHNLNGLYPSMKNCDVDVVCKTVPTGI